MEVGKNDDRLMRSKACGKHGVSLRYETFHKTVAWFRFDVLVRDMRLLSWFRRHTFLYCMLHKREGELFNMYTCICSHI